MSNSHQSRYPIISPHYLLASRLSPLATLQKRYTVIRSSRSREYSAILRRYLSLSTPVGNCALMMKKWMPLGLAHSVYRYPKPCASAVWRSFVGDPSVDLPWTKAIETQTYLGWRFCMCCVCRHWYSVSVILQELLMATLLIALIWEQILSLLQAIYSSEFHHPTWPAATVETRSCIDHINGGYGSLYPEKRAEFVEIHRTWSVCIHLTHGCFH